MFAWPCRCLVLGAGFTSFMNMKVRHQCTMFRCMSGVHSLKPGVRWKFRSTEKGLHSTSHWKFKSKTCGVFITNSVLKDYYQEVGLFWISLDFLCFQNIIAKRYLSFSLVCWILRNHIKHIAIFLLSFSKPKILHNLDWLHLSDDCYFLSWWSPGNSKFSRK